MSVYTPLIQHSRGKLLLGQCPRQAWHTSAYLSIRQHTSAYVTKLLLGQCPCQALRWQRESIILAYYYIYVRILLACYYTYSIYVCPPPALQLLVSLLVELDWLAPPKKNSVSLSGCVSYKKVNRAKNRNLSRLISNLSRLHWSSQRNCVYCFSTVFTLLQQQEVPSTCLRRNHPCLVF